MLVYPLLFLAVIVSEDGLTALLKGVEDVHSLGELLGITEGSLEAIKIHYGDHTLSILSHVLRLWLISDPEDPVKQLRMVLDGLGALEIAQQLIVLTTLGNYFTILYLITCEKSQLAIYTSTKNIFIKCMKM